MRITGILLVIIMGLTGCAPQAIYQIKDDKYENKYNVTYMEQNYLLSEKPSISVQFNLMKADIPGKKSPMVRLYTANLRFPLENGSNMYLVLNDNIKKRIWFSTVKDPEIPGGNYLTGEKKSYSVAMRMIAYYDISTDTINKIISSEKAALYILQDSKDTPGREFRKFRFTDDNRELMKKFLNEFIK